jgi:hypothetical protein
MIEYLDKEISIILALAFKSATLPRHRYARSTTIFPAFCQEAKSSSRNKIVVDLAGSARPRGRRRDEERHSVSPRLRRVEQRTG